MRRVELNTLLIGGLILAVSLGLLAGHFARAPGAPPLKSALRLEQSRPVPQFQLVNAQGQTVGRDSLRDSWHLVFFGFTQCPDICPNTLSMLKQVIAGLTPQNAAQLRVLFVSVDPERDTPAQLARYVAHFNPDYRALTGNEPALEQFARALSAAFVRVPQGDSYTVDHTTALVLLNPAVEVAAFLPAPHRIPDLVADLNLLLQTP